MSESNPTIPAEQDIVCVASSDWDHEAPLNVHHLMRRLGARHRVLFVESPGLRVPSASGRDWSKVARRVRGALRSVRHVSENVHVLSPLLLPIHGRRWTEQFNARVLSITVRRAMKALGMTRPILWIFLPPGVALAGRLGERLLIYHCVDAYEENPGVDRDAVLELEHRLLARCDLRFATSPALHAEKRPVRGDAHYLPNVAESERFAAGGPIPPELEAVPRPRLGYVGNVADYKVDLDLLDRLAKAHPSWQLCLVGPIGAGDPTTDVSALQQSPNVRIFGPRPHAELPGWTAGFDACLIPFRTTASTRASFPLKFFEYMAAGKPIVSTPLPSLQEYAQRTELCRFASGHAAFAEAVAAALSEVGSPELTAARRAEAMRHSWAERMIEIDRIVGSALLQKAGPR